MLDLINNMHLFAYTWPPDVNEKLEFYYGACISMKRENKNGDMPRLLRNANNSQKYQSKVR